MQTLEETAGCQMDCRPNENDDEASQAYAHQINTGRFGEQLLGDMQQLHGPNQNNHRAEACTLNPEDRFPPLWFHLEERRDTARRKMRSASTMAILFFWRRPPGFTVMVLGVQRDADERVDRLSTFARKLLPVIFTSRSSS